MEEIKRVYYKLNNNHYIIYNIISNVQKRLNYEKKKSVYYGIC